MYINYLKKTIPIKGRFFPAFSFVANRDGVSACVSMSGIKKLAGIPYYFGSIYIDAKWYDAIFREKSGDLYNVGTRKKPQWLTTGTRLFSSFDRKIKDERYKAGGELPCPLFAEAKEKNTAIKEEKALKAITPTLQRDLNSYEYIPMKNTRYELSKQNADNADYGVAIGTDTPVYAATGKVDRFVKKTKKVDYTEQKPIYSGKTSTTKTVVRSEYLAQFNEEDWAEVIFRDTMIALRDDFA